MLVFVVDTNFIVKDGVKASLTRFGDLLHFSEVFAITIAKGKNCPTGSEHLLPKMRERARIGVGVDVEDLLCRGAERQRKDEKSLC
jgi:hypothetical protein